MNPHLRLTREAAIAECERRGIALPEGADRRYAINALCAADRIERGEEPAQGNGSRSRDSLADMLADALRDRIGTQALDEARVRELIAEESAARKSDVDADALLAMVNAAIEKAGTLRIEVRERGEVRTIEGRAHSAFPRLLAFVQAGVPVYLCGPAGSFKTSAADMLGKVLDRPVYVQPLCEATMPHEILGYMDAAGNYHETGLFKAYRDGGIYVADEIDKANANAIACLNAILANGHCLFPCGNVERHENFVCIATANTFGLGASREYVGANQLDAATLNRFAFIAWDYDVAMEREIALAHAQNDQQRERISEWLSRVLAWRANASRNRLRVVIGPRQSLYGARMIATGQHDLDMLADSLVFAALDADTAAKVRNA